MTDKLIKAGYQQARDGYIEYAHETGINVDYTQAEPSQWWHLIKSYCDRTDSSKRFTKTIKCGELYFWMAEMSGAFEILELENLASEALEKAKRVKRRKNNLPPIDTAGDSNLLIRDFCFDRIKAMVESY